MGDVLGIKLRLEKKLGSDELLKVCGPKVIELMASLYIVFSTNVLASRMRSKRIFAIFPAFISLTMSEFEVSKADYRLRDKQFTTSSPN